MGNTFSKWEMLSMQFHHYAQRGVKNELLTIKEQNKKLIESISNQLRIQVKTPLGVGLGITVWR